MNLKYLSIFIASFLLIVLVVFAADKAENTNFNEAKENIVIRKIGHEILLHSGDSTSRVLPVKHLSENEYQLQFESSLSFFPDSLAKIIQQVISANDLPNDYVVNVIECAHKEVVFGFAILGSEQNTIVPCTERKQPQGCYYINLTFKTKFLTANKKYVIAAIGMVAMSLIFFGLNLYKKRQAITGTNEKDDGPKNIAGIQIGQYLFNNDELIIGEEKIMLSMKESKLLSIFANSPNQIIDRNRLQKEVWEDEGVIVGRSLDMFISKLRKKLEKDPAVKLVNIHSKGYKLVITT